MSARPTPVSGAQHTLRQLQLVVPGGAITYYLGTFQEIWRIVQGAGGSWGRTAAFGALGHGLATVVLFGYLLMSPWITGVEPNYRSWKESDTLSAVIPVLTATIVIGLLLLVLTLGQWSSLGYVKSIIGVCAVYALVFGVLGLLPVPKLKRK